MADSAKSSLMSNSAGILFKDACVVLVKTEWNSAIVDELAAGAIRILAEQGVTRIVRITVPGAVEIPFTIRSFWKHTSKKFRPDAFIALGAVIRGGTPHFEYVCKMVSEGILALNMELPVPSIFGVLTLDNEEQARERIGGIHGHKGEEAAMTAVKMIAVNRSFKKGL